MNYTSSIPHLFPVLSCRFLDGWPGALIQIDLPEAASEELPEDRRPGNRCGVKPLDGPIAAAFACPARNA
ncbi:MAG: hypothetical protein IH586_13735 [Anaerolineaceae bacterium]|nr:hypothetical protein [Anaerolineaceae bacterium]